MAIVIDSSAIVALAMDDEVAAASEAAVRALIDEGGFAPALFWYEVRNALVMSERRGRAQQERIEQFLKEVEALPIALDFPPSSEAVMDLARRHTLTVYDAAYLELALRLDSPLVSLDGRLVAAVDAAGGKTWGG
jgi:predicted nucleic acid-binding protein